MNNTPTSIIKRPNVKVVIEGGRVVLRPISEKEINNRYVSWLNDPEINRFLEVSSKGIQSIKSVIDYVNERRSKGCDVFAIFTKKKHIHIGTLGLIKYNPQIQDYASFGIMIGDRKAQMLGLGGEAYALMVEFLFSIPNILRIQNIPAANNYKICRTLEILGFKKDAILKEHITLASGKNDAYLYGMNREEWVTNKVRVANLLKGVKITEFIMDDDLFYLKASILCI